MRLCRILSSSLLLASALFPALSAHANDLSEADKARSTMRRVISCAMYSDWGKGAGRALAVLEGNFEGKAFDDLYDGIQTCVWQNNYEGRWVEQLRFAPIMLKGEIFRSVLLDGWGVRIQKNLAPKFRRLAAVPRDPNSNPLGAFGVCVATLDPQNARKAIASPTAGPDESAAYAALAPSMAQCVAPGQSIAFSKQVLEGALAEGLFVRTYAAPTERSAGRAN